MLRFIESRTDYSVYAEPDGTPVYFMHRLPAYNGWSAPLTAGFDDFVMALDAINSEPDLDRSMRLSRLADVFDDSWARSDAEVCGPDVSPFEIVVSGCNMLVHTDEMMTISGNRYCESCRDGFDYSMCTGCDEFAFYVVQVGGYYSDARACESCRDSETSFCTHCDYLYWDDDSGDHTHPEMCDDECESPLTSFSIPLGEGFLRNLDTVSETSDTTHLHNDRTVALTVASDEAISGHGLSLIYNELVNWACYNNPAPWDESNGRFWSTVYRAHEGVEKVWKTGAGTYSRRLRSAIYKAIKADLLASGDTTHKAFTLTDDLLSSIGTIGYEHSRPVEMSVSITRELNGSARDFAHADSCWWGSYSYSRCVLKSNGGFGLRAFDPDSGYVTGRVWVMPMVVEQAADGFGRDRLVPTLGEAEAYVVFNGYRSLSERTGPRVMSTLTGWDFVGANFCVDDDVMYVNGGTAHVLAPESILERVRTESLRITTSFDRHAYLTMPTTVSEMVNSPEMAMA